MTLLLFFEVKAVIEEHYERRIEFYRVLSALLLTSVFSAEVQAVEDFIPAGHKGLR